MCRPRIVRLPKHVVGISVGAVLAFSVLAGALQAAEPSQDKEPGVNVALGAKYTLWPQPNYSYCTDPDDAVQLTDGKSTSGYFWTQKGTVGWSSAPYAVVTVDLANSTDRPLEVHLGCEGLPGSPMPGCVTAHEVPWTDSSPGTPVAAALPEARKAKGGWGVTVLPGLVRRVWLTFHVTDQAPGEHAGKIVFRSEGIEPLGIPLRLRTGQAGR